MSPSNRPQAVIVGGGLSGAATALHLAKFARSPLDIHLIEPRGVLGAGLAYSTEDPDHRVNGAHRIMMVEAGDPHRFTEWTRAQGIDDADPEGWARPDEFCCRRAVVGQFMAAQVADAMRENPSGSAIRHWRTRALDASGRPGETRVALANGQVLSADLLVIATGNELPARPKGLSDAIAADPRYVPNPWDLERLRAIPKDARVLILGTGLTMGDVAVSLLRRGHTGGIVAVSRRGLLPQLQPTDVDVAALHAGKAAGGAGFAERHGPLRTASAILHALRQDIRADEAAGIHWTRAFDQMRNDGPRLWQALPPVERQRVMRHLKPWFETRRYRAAPQVLWPMEEAMAKGQLSVMAGRIAAIMPAGPRIAVALTPRGGRFVGEAFDAVVNCTGPDGRASQCGNEFLAAITASGLAADDPDGNGLWVASEGRVRDAQGVARDDWRVIGPPGRGWYGDHASARQIALQLAEVTPGMAALLAEAAERGTTAEGA